jgi:multidrug efflux pump subunit AcrA (membrane-fusion protein)
MKTDVDLRELAFDRGGTAQPSLKTRRHVLTRYVLPLTLILGFLSLVAWASRDLVFPPQSVTVVPVYSTTAEIQQEGTPLFKAAGWIEPRPTPVRVTALAPGVVQQLLVVEDQQVKVGEPIAELVKDDAKLSYDRAIAEHALRRAELDEVKASLTAAETRFEQPVHLEAALGEAEASLAKIQTQLTNLPFETRRAEAELDAMQKDYDGKLSAEGVVAGVEIDIARSKSDSAKALVEELNDRSASLQKERAALSHRRDALKTQLELLADETRARDEAQAKVDAASARVAQADVAVAEAKLQLDRMTIIAPINGRIFRLIAHPGARLPSGGGISELYDGSTVVTMYRPEMLQVRVDVRFEDIPNVSHRQPVEINNPALAAPLTGSVLFMSSEANIQKNTLQVKVAIPEPPSVFKPEMLVDVTFLSPKLTAENEAGQESSVKRQTIARVFVLQQFVIRNDGSEPFVWVADQSAKVARRQTIQTGAIRGNELVEVTSGLTIASRLIATGTDTLTDGCRIRIAGEDPRIGVAAKPPDSGS